MNISVVLNQMIQLFLIIGLGYILFKIEILNDFANKNINTLILKVTMPAMILSSVMNENNADPNLLLQVFIISLIVYALLPIIGLIITKIMNVNQKEKGLYIFMTVFSNVGFMGFPVMKSIFGQESIFYTAIFNMIFNLLVYTLGIILINYGREKKAKINYNDLISPGIIASIIAIIIFLLRIKVPVLIENTCSMIGDMTTPLAMLMIGSTLSNIKISEIFNDLKIYLYTIIKQILVPMISFPILNTFIDNPLVLGITLIILSMPVGNSAVIFSYEYDGDVALAAKGVFITTALSVITIPLIVSLFLV